MEYTTRKLEGWPVASTSAVSSPGSFRTPVVPTIFLWGLDTFWLADMEVGSILVSCLVMVGWIKGLPPSFITCASFIETIERLWLEEGSGHSQYCWQAHITGPLALLTSPLYQRTMAVGQGGIRGQKISIKARASTREHYNDCKYCRCWFFIYFF